MSTAAPEGTRDRLDGLDWAALQERLDVDGVATTPPLLSPGQCAEVVAMFDEDERFRSTVVMARHAFGEGSYRYFADPLPPLVQTLREQLYPPLATVANRWAGLLGERTFPTTLDDLLAECAALGQHRPTPLVLRYGPGGYNCLHQDVYGDLTFPLQFLVMLSRPDEDFTGGESVFVEQRPRQQSRPVVLRPRQGEAVIFPVRNRPKLGSRGHHRVQMRHGVSAVHSGNRHVLGIIFHNAR
ncbi:2OG-Fe(II) oxygenase [Pseudonocardia xinjiangensis]|uniref:2OG-Fe(II) oxygenase n=1 Tax=Pseudonocardia xinjiangensis TaxID=75289 RepID=A0ABX1RAJ3_9PSEU|nr:2OG-Fe(II) oxygenase [Pseudonocardia xinjiangensis]NMH77412.1 2OG-Fe(II) oxygenase [Pseudonocardia xinjiangensis]